MPPPSRGEVWLTRFGTGDGHEQQGTRPALIISVDPLNHGPAGLVVVVPITSKTANSRLIPAHIPADPPDGGLMVPSVVLCDQVRAVSTDRLISCWGVLDPATLARVEDVLRLLLGL